MSPWLGALEWTEAGTITVKAVYESGVFRPQETVHLDEHIEVEVLILEKSVAGPTGWKAAEALVGFIEEAPPDMAEDHDRYHYHYLCGQRKACASNRQYDPS